MKRFRTQYYKKLGDLLQDVSAFELMNSDVVREIISACQRVDAPEDLIVSLTSRLSVDGCSSVSSSTPLVRFVRHLQSIISQVERFVCPEFGGINSIYHQIRLAIVPHSETKEKQPDANNKGNNKGTKKGGRGKADEDSIGDVGADGKGVNVTIEPSGASHFDDQIS